MTYVQLFGGLTIYRLEKTYRFEAAHVLPNHGGKCARRHGHSFVCTVVVEGNRLQQQGPETGMLMDYARIDAAMKPLLELYLDHYDLNESLIDLDSQTAKNPTSENLARMIYELLKQCPDSYVKFNVAEVRIEETCTCRCVYRPDLYREPD